MSNLAEKFASKLKPMYEGVLRDYTLILVVAAILVLIWFRKDLLMGAGESFLLFYKPYRDLQLSKYIWNDMILGQNIPTMLPASPFFLILSIMEQLGAQEFFLQALTFWALLLTGGLGTYHLTLALMNDENRLSAVLAGLFYMLNPFVMIQIWKRFIISFMFFYALLPLAFFLYARGLMKQKTIYCFYVGAASIGFSLAFTMAPFIATFWLILLTFSILCILINLNDKSKIFYAIKFFLVTFSLWLLLNAWWFIQFIIWTFEQPTVLINQSIMSTELLLLIRLIQPENVYSIWGTIYSEPIFEIISFLTPFLVFSSLLLKPRSKTVMYLMILSILSLFFAKGTASPFGEIFGWMVNRIPALSVFRNPYEKLGMMLPLAYAPLFGITLSSLYQYSRKTLQLNFKASHIAIKIKPVFTKILAIIICFLVLGVYLWPMWTGAVFMGAPPSNNPEIGYYVSVPQYYSEANAWINSYPMESRLIVLPLDGEGITYNWTYGYSGWELSNELFDRQAVSFTTGYTETYQPFDQALILNVENSLFTNGQSFWKLAALLNAKYIIVRSDINYEIRAMKNPSKIEEALQYATLPNIVNGNVVSPLLSVKPLQTEVDAPMKNWSLIWGGATFVADRNDTMQSAYSVLYTTQRSSGTVWIVRSFPNATDWSNASYLELWFKSGSACSLCIDAVTSGQDNRLEWDGRVNSAYSIAEGEVNTWKLFVLPLNVPTSTIGYPDLSSVTGISIQVYPNHTDEPITFKVGGMFLDGGRNVKIENIKYSRTFGKLNIYEVDDAHFLPRIYATNQFVFSDDIQTMLFKTIANDSFTPGNTIIFLLNQSNINNFTFLNNLKNDGLYKPTISFEKIDPTKFIVHINASKPFFLMFSESYDKNWVAYVDGKAENRHFIANGYANAWYIDKTGSFDVTLEFSQQKLVNYGVIISLVAFVSCTAYFLRDRLRTRFHRIYRRILRSSKVD